MIQPTKYMNLETCTINVAAKILSELRDLPAIPLEELDEMIRSSLGDLSRFNFVSALNFLYMLDCIDYNLQDDTIVSTSVNRSESIQ